MNRVPNLFKMAWIKTRQTPEEMGLLFGHANNIGLNQILLYPFDYDGSYIGRVEYAAQQAWYQQQWLLRLRKEVMQKWCCTEPYYYFDFCDLLSWWYTGVEEWL